MPRMNQTLSGGIGGRANKTETGRGRHGDGGIETKTEADKNPERQREERWEMGEVSAQGMCQK